MLVAWKDGAKDRVPIVTLEEIIQKTNTAIKQGNLEAYFAELAGRISGALNPASVGPFQESV